MSSSDLNSGFTNNNNIITIGISHNVSIYTDRPLIPGDGNRGALLDKTEVGHQVWDNGEVFSPPGSGTYAV